MNEINNDNIFGQNQQNMNNSNKNQGPQNNNFYQGMNQPNNNNNNQMMNQNMRNMGNTGNMMFKYSIKIIKAILMEFKIFE